MANVSQKPLWRHGLNWLRDTDPSTHWADRDRAFGLAQGLRKLGAQPPYQGDVRRYVHELWDDPHVVSMVRDCWSSVYRAKTSRGRARHSRSNPLYVPDMLIRDAGLRPTTEVRLAAVARDAVNALIESAPETDATYRHRKRELSAALTAVDELRSLRLRDG